MFPLLLYWLLAGLSYLKTYVSYFKVLSHKKIERCAGLGSNTADGRATVVQESGT